MRRAVSGVLIQGKPGKGSFTMSRLLLSLMLAWSLLTGLSVTATGTGEEILNARAGPKEAGHIFSSPGTADGRQGGEDIGSAVVIPSFPFSDNGNTCDNSDDYDEVCPYIGSTSPDVVYAYTPAYDEVINIDLCGSGYDTKLYVYCESEGSLVACNDDYYFGEPCGQYVSFLDNVVLFAGLTYYIVIDGYGGDCGDYELYILEYLPCIVECPPDAVLEGEPELVDGYIDNYNGGCNSTPPVFQVINWVNADDCAWLCGTSGWFTSAGSNRDTDWFPVVALAYEIEWTIDADYAVQCFVIVPDYDCPGTYDIPYQFTAGPCLQNTLSFATNPGEEYWLWVGPTVFEGPVYEFTYSMTVCGIQVDVIASRQTTLGALKSLYR